MSLPPIRPETVQRLRANAARAGIKADEDDLNRIVAGAYLRNVEALDRLVSDIPSDTLPDYLKDWTPPAPGDDLGGPAQ